MPNVCSPDVVVAQTVFYFPFELSAFELSSDRPLPDLNELTQSVRDAISALDSLTTEDRTGRHRHSIWAEHSPKSSEIAELDGALQSLFGYRDAPSADWSWKHRQATRPVVEQRLGNLKVWDPKGRHVASFRLNNAAATLFPLGNGILRIEVDWTATPGLSLEVLEEGVRFGTLCLAERQGGIELEQPPTPDGVDSTGQLSGRFGLIDLANWLVGQRRCGENQVEAGQFHWTKSRRTPHLTTLVLDGAEDEDFLHHVWSIQHCMTRDEGKPPADVAIETKMRSERGFAISLQGLVSYAFLSRDGSDREFLEQQWPRKVHGVYQLLLLHAMSERLTLSFLARSMASLAGQLRSALEPNGRLDFHELYVRAHGLLTAVVAHTVSTTAESTGGKNDYSEFFSVTRTKFRIREMLAEVRQQSADLFALVSTSLQRDEQIASERIQHAVNLVTVTTIPLSVVIALIQTPQVNEWIQLHPTWGGIASLATLGILSLAAWNQVRKRN